MNTKSGLVAAAHSDSDNRPNGATKLKWSCVWKVSEPDLYGTATYHEYELNATQTSTRKIKKRNNKMSSNNSQAQTHRPRETERDTNAIVTHTLRRTSNTTWINYYYVTIFEYLNVSFVFFSHSKNILWTHGRMLKKSRRNTLGRKTNEKKKKKL